uniref:Acetyl-coenzyme A transporter 1 n=1 Tax=Lygus hesperus TaxID=30085 RepID=A0A0K8TJM3_LYGHE
MRRRREEVGGGDDEAEEELMGDEERRGSDAGSHFVIRGDEWNIALLLILYLLQGIPLGLSATIPMIIQNKGVSFKEQAEFSFTMWPFSLKLLWAPLVDSLYWPSFGRRKTWLVPAQYLIGFFMIFLSFHIDTWLSAENPQVGFLTILFFAMNFLAATQDIAVDGWALTMLKRQNKSLASTCNTVGQTAGFFLGYVVFMALESASFCNSYLRVEPLDEGMISLPGFLYFWGSVYLLMTTLVAFIKRENLDVGGEAPSARAAFGSYHLLLRILKLPNIQLFAFLLLTSKIGFAAFDGVTSLKFIEKGVPKEKLAVLAVPIVPLQIILPIIITKMNHPRRPMDLYLKAFPYRLAFNLVGALFVCVTPMIIKANTDIPFYYYFLLTGILAIHQVTTSAMFVQQMAFFAMVSDADAGGTYMTLLNTLANLGGTWTSTTALAAVDSFTYRSCVGSNLTVTNDCSVQSLKTECAAAGGSCVTDVDGYYVEVALLTVVGIVWFWFSRRKIDYLQSRPLSSWVVPRR